MQKLQFVKSKSVKNFVILPFLQKNQTMENTIVLLIIRRHYATTDYVSKHSEKNKSPCR